QLDRPLPLRPARVRRGGSGRGGPRGGGAGGPHPEHGGDGGPVARRPPAPRGRPAPDRGRGDLRGPAALLRRGRAAGRRAAAVAPGVLRPAGLGPSPARALPPGHLPIPSAASIAATLSSPPTR